MTDPYMPPPLRRSAVAREDKRIYFATELEGGEILISDAHQRVILPPLVLQQLLRGLEQEGLRCS